MTRVQTAMTMACAPQTACASVFQDGQDNTATCVITALSQHHLEKSVLKVVISSDPVQHVCHYQLAVGVWELKKEGL